MSRIKDYDDIEFKEVDRVRKVHRKKHYLLRFLIFIGIVAGVYIFLRSDYFSIKEIRVEGNTYYTDEEVIGLAKARTGSNIIFSPGIKEMKERLEKEPYFGDVDISRKLPGTIKITVTERAQTAAVLYGDSYIVIDKAGTVLRKTDIDPQLTVLTGLTISKMNVGEAMEVEESDSLATTLRMLDAMKEGDIYFKKIDVAKVMLHCYIYDSLIVKGTPNEIMNSIENKQLQKVVSDLFGESITRGTIKMSGEDYLSFSPEVETD